MADKNQIYIVGDIRYTESAELLYSEDKKSATDFLLALQNIMEKYGVVKLDVATDAFKYSSCKTR
jgi:hypothetical protein